MPLWVPTAVPTTLLLEATNITLVSMCALHIIYCVISFFVCAPDEEQSLSKTVEYLQHPFWAFGGGKGIFHFYSKLVWWLLVTVNEAFKKNIYMSQLPSPACVLL